MRPPHPLCLLLLCLLLPTHAFYRVPPASVAAATAFPQPQPSTTRLRSDAFFNFEGLKRRLNLTHFGDPGLESSTPLMPLEEEDFASRPDLVKAREIAAALAPDFTAPTQYPSVALYFHVAAHHLQSFREGLHEFVASQSQAAEPGEKEVFWEAFQLVGLPAALEDTRYSGSQAGRVPSRSRLLLCGTFATPQAEEQAKQAVVAWLKALKARVAAYRLGGEAEEDDPVETMPMSQAVYRRVRPFGPPARPPAAVADPAAPSSVFLLAFLQASWSSERKIRRHLERVHAYLDAVTRPEEGLAERAELYIDPAYPSAHRIWHQFPSEAAMIACLSGPYMDLLGDGAKFRARVNHVEQAFVPLGNGDHAFAPFLSAPLSGRTHPSYMPLVGFGTDVFRGREREGNLPLGEAVRTAVRAGCRLLDCSPGYGRQAEVGQALREVLASGETRRERLFVVSSLRQDVAGEPSQVQADVHQTLEELGLAYLDALLLPPFEEETTPKAMWRAMEALVDGGLVRHLGVAGLSLERLRALQEDPALVRRPAVCALEHHPFYRDDDLVTYCQEQGIQLLAHTPLGRPARSRPPGTNPLQEPLVDMSAAALECSPAQVVLRWAVQQGIAVVPNSLSRAHILENVNLHSFTMAPFRVDVLNEMAAVRDLRFATPFSTATAANGPPFSLAEVQAQNLIYADDGTVMPPGTPYEYLQLTVEVFERLDLGDVAELVVEPREIDGVFPGMDVEPIEEGGDEGL